MRSGRTLLDRLQFPALGPRDRILRFFRTHGRHGTDTPKLAVAERFVRSKPLHLAVTVFGEPLDSASLAEVSYDIAIHRPVSRTIEIKSLVAVPRRKVDPRSVQTAQMGIRHVAEEKHSLGKHRVRVVAHDRVKGQTAESDASFDVVAPEALSELPRNFAPAACQTFRRWTAFHIHNETKAQK